MVCWCSWLSHVTHTDKVAGSNPAYTTFCFGNDPLPVMLIFVILLRAALYIVQRVRELVSM